MLAIFITVLEKILPLYALILLGILVGRKLPDIRENLSKALVYVLMPVVVFYGAYTVKLTPVHMALPILLFSLATLACVLAYQTAGIFWQTSERNILSYTAGTGNTGYFGVPLTLLILGKSYIGLVVLGNIGMILYEVTIGMFILAHAHASAAGSIKRLFKLPVIYAFSLGAICNHWSVELPDTMISVLEICLGGYAFFGMLIIGIGIADIKKLNIDWLFIGYSMINKFIVWPLLAFAFIFLDKQFYHALGDDVILVTMLLAATPLAANTVVISSFFNIHPEKSAIAVAVSTLFALIYLPAYVQIFHLS